MGPAHASVDETAAIVHEPGAIALILVALVGTTLLAGLIAGFMESAETGKRLGKWVFVIGTFFAATQIFRGTLLLGALGVLAVFWLTIWFVTKKRMPRGEG